MTVTINTKQGPKQYSTVAERLTALHEAGKTLEVLESAPVAVGDGFIWRVLLKVDNLTYVGNAEVHLNSTNFAEKADPFATAETSAVGRALAWCGYAGTPDNPSIASADEVIRAQAQQNGNKPAQPKRATEETKPQSSESPVYREVYLAGGKKHLWSNQSGFYAFASAELGMAVSADNVKLLDSEQIAQLAQAVEEEAATAAK